MVSKARAWAKAQPMCYSSNDGSLAWVDSGGELMINGTYLKRIDNGLSGSFYLEDANALLLGKFLVENYEDKDISSVYVGLPEAET